MENVFDLIRLYEGEINAQGFLIEYTDPVTIEEVQEAQTALQFSFPEVYTSFITTHGLPAFKSIKSGQYFFDTLYPVYIIEDMALVKDEEGEQNKAIAIFQKFGLQDAFEFYAFDKNGAVVSYFDDGATVRSIAPNFVEHIKTLLQSIVDGSYRNRHTPHLPYDKAAFDAREQEQANRADMLTTFQEAGKWLKNPDKERLLKALELYEHTIDYFRTGKVTDDYYLANAHALCVWTSSNLIGNYRQQLTTEEIHTLRQRLIQHAQHTLALTPADTTNPNEKNNIRIAANAQSWHMSVDTHQPELLEKALTIVQQGIDQIESAQHYYIYDTQVRILLKLDRKEEAYRIVQQVLTEVPDFSDFLDFKDNADYNKFTKAQ